MRSFLFVWLTVLGVSSQEYTLPFLDCKSNTSFTRYAQLTWHLLCNYEIDVRPTSDHTHATHVDVGLHLQHFTVHDLVGTVDFHLFLSMTWNDTFLKWKPSQFEDITKVHVKSFQIWVPDVTLQSASHKTIDGNLPKTDCLVLYTGNVICVPQIMFPIYCERDTTWWPYDIMNCSIQLSSLAHSSEDISLKFATLDSSNETKIEILDGNPRWDITHITTHQIETNSKLSSDITTTLLSYNILLKRRAAIYSTSYITIAIVLVTVTLLVLWLEPKSTERMMLANMNFILHLLSSLHMAWSIPHCGGRQPKIHQLYEDSLILATFSLVLTILLRHMQEMTIKAPSWLSSIVITSLKSRVGQIFLVNFSDPKLSAQIVSNNDDNTNLVSFDKVELTWRYTSIVIGWLAFVIVLFTYIILLIVRLPTSKSAYFVV
ncbi:nicotinic acetylcholine receptor beta2 subunit isoform X1 [Lasioglossum baleicum]|uniref:nicotinic acetylcholine receptor beta2 subunit isoform X1 n=1 Tax=Lasioglossum baleicum TaxID=434251 RepID=UPI003FCD9350